MILTGGHQQFASPEEVLAHISEAPWSNWTKADYTVEQWHAACIIHIHDGAPTSKSECKLPVKTPDGTLNRNGVHAAAAALAGARGGLKGVSADQKSKAASALKRYYSQLDEDPPESLSQSGIDHRTKPGSPSDILEHYGVKGMRWGVRNVDKPAGRDSGGVAAPATSGRDSSGRITAPPTTKLVKEQSQSGLSEKKQQKVDKFLARSEVMGTTIADLKLENEKLAGTQNPAKLWTKKANETAIKDLERAQARALQDAEAVKKGKLTSAQKQAIIGGVAVTGIIVAGLAATKLVEGQQSGAINSFMLRSSAALRGQKTPFALNKELSKPMSAADLLNKVAKPVNPGYSSMGGKMNCRRSTYAYELRRRGFDVHATTSAVGWGQSESGVINAVTPGSRNFYNAMSLSQGVVSGQTLAPGDKRRNPLQKTVVDNLIDISRTFQNQPQSSSARVLEALGKQPNGARGEVLFKFKGFGHSMAYEVVDGVPHIFDSQKGTLYNAATKMVESKWDGFNSAEITRLDNVDLDIGFLTRWATNVRGK